MKLARGGGTGPHPQALRLEHERALFLLSRAREPVVGGWVLQSPATALTPTSGGFASAKPLAYRGGGVKL
jgi:hypothetical protein